MALFFFFISRDCTEATASYRKHIKFSHNKLYLSSQQSALLLSETLKEREMQIKVKEMMNPPSKAVEERIKMQLVFVVCSVKLS